MGKTLKESPKILGLDISTRTIGWALFDIQSQELLLKSEIFKTKLIEYVNLGIVKVIIEEPLLNSNNIYTVSTLMRFNTLICKEVYDILGVVPEFVSTYNSRKFAFPHLVQPNDKGKYVLFGGFPKDIDKKVIIWELVAKREPQILWQYTKNNTLKKENYDQTDAYCAALGFMKMKEIW